MGIHPVLTYIPTNRTKETFSHIQWIPYFFKAWLLIQHYYKLINLFCKCMPITTFSKEEIAQINKLYFLGSPSIGACMHKRNLRL